MKVLAVIPARAHSKRIKDKNVKILGGKPLVCHTIEAALESRLIDQIVISTDIPEMPRIASRYGAGRLQVLWRERALCGDLVPTEDVLMDAVRKLGLRNTLEAVVTLLPTSPFRRASHIDACLRLFFAKKADSVITISRAKLKIGRLNERTGRFALLDKDTPAEMHHIPLTACENPAVHVTRPEVLSAGRFTIGPKNYAVELDKISGWDINDPSDWLVAEAMLKAGLVRHSGTSRT